MAYVNLKITGMTCDHCAASVEQALKAQRGVCAAQVGYRQGLAHVEYEPDVVNIAALRQAVQIMEHLLAQPLTDEQLLTIQHQLQETLTSLRDLRRTSSTTGDMWRLLQPFTRRSADFSPQNTWSRKI